MITKSELYEIADLSFYSLINQRESVNYFPKINLEIRNSENIEMEDDY